MPQAKWEEEFNERFRFPSGQWHLAGRSDEILDFIRTQIEAARQEGIKEVADWVIPELDKSLTKFLDKRGQGANWNAGLRKAKLLLQTFLTPNE